MSLSVLMGLEGQKIKPKNAAAELAQEAMLLDGIDFSCAEELRRECVDQSLSLPGLQQGLIILDLGSAP